VLPDELLQPAFFSYIGTLKHPANETADFFVRCICVDIQGVLCFYQSPDDQLKGTKYLGHLWFHKYPAGYSKKRKSGIPCRGL
jgi:hypothetical protein